MDTPITSPIPVIIDVEKGSSEEFKDWSTQKIALKSKNNNLNILVNPRDLEKKTNTSLNQKDKDLSIFYRSEFKPSNYSVNKEERRRQAIMRKSLGGNKLLQRQKGLRAKVHDKDDAVHYIYFMSRSTKGISVGSENISNLRYLSYIPMTHSEIFGLLLLLCMHNIYIYIYIDYSSTQPQLSLTEQHSMKQTQ